MNASSIPTVEILPGGTPATLFRRYDSDGSGRPCAVREERLFDSNLQRLALCILESKAHADGDYFIATDRGDLEHDAIATMHARGDFGSTLMRVAD